MKVFDLLFHKNSGNIARERLKGVVLADRFDCTPETAQKIQKDISEVLMKYLELDHVTIKIQLELSREVGQGVKHVKTIQIKRL